MVRNKYRASIAKLMLATASVVGFSIAGGLLGNGGQSAWADNAAALELQQHNMAMQLKPTGVNHNYPVITALAIDPRGELLAASGDDHVIRILSRVDLTLLAELKGHEDWVQSLDFAPDGGLLVSVGNDGQLITWTRDEAWKREVGMANMPALRAVRFSPNGTSVASVGFSPRLYLMGIGNDKRPTLDCGCRDLRTLDFRGDGMVLAAAGRSGDLYLYDAVTGSTIADVKLNRRRIYEIEFIGQTTRIVTASEDGHAIIYDTESREVIHDLFVPGSKLLALCMIGTSHLAVGGSDNIIRIFDVDSGTLVDELRGHSGSIASLKSTDGILYSGSFDTTVRRWNLAGILAGATVADGADEHQPTIRTSRLP